MHSAATSTAPVLANRALGRRAGWAVAVVGGAMPLVACAGGGWLAAAALAPLAVVVAAALGGVRPGLLAGAMTGLSAAWLFADAAPPSGGQAAGMVVGWAGASLAVAPIVARLRRPAGRRAAAGRERAMLESLRDGVFALDHQWRITYMSARAARYLGQPGEPLIGRVLWDAFPAARGTLFEREYARALREQRAVRFEAHVARSDRWIEVHACPSDDGLTVQFRDVTRYRESAAALAESEARLRIALDVGRLGTWSFEPATGATTCDDATRATIGVPLGTRVEPGTLLTGIHPDDRERVQRAAIHAFTSGIDYDAEYRFRDAEGRERWLHARGRSIRDPDGRPVRVVGVTQDVTERRRAEASLLESEARFRALADSAPVLIWVYGADHRCQFANRATAEFLGISVEEILADGAVGAIHPDDHERYASGYLQAVAERRRFEGSARVRRHDGAWRWVESVGVPRLAPDGTLLCYVGCSWDVTAQREIEDAVRRRNAELETILRILPVGLAIAHDAAVERVTLNPHFEELLRLAPGRDGACASPGREATPFVWLRDGDTVPAGELPMHRACRLGESVLGRELQVRFPDDTVRHLLVNAAPLFDGAGRVCGAVGAHVDVTRLRRTEEALRASQERLALAQRAGRVGVFDWQLGDATLLLTDETLCLLGIPAEAFRGTIEAWCEHLDPSDAERVAAELWALVAAGAPEARAEYRVVLPDGRRRWLCSHGRIEYAGGSPTRIIGVTFDIDDQRRAAEALQEADRRKDEFLAMLAHELRNPLAPIRTAAALLRRVDANGPRGELAKAMIERQVAHMARLLDDLLDVSRITRGRITLRAERVSLASVLEQALDTVRPLVERRGHVLAVELPPEPVSVHGDGARLVQVFANLLGNAAKFSEPRGWIGLTVARDGSEVVARVRDTGIGITPELLPRIFDLFVQGDVSLDRQQGGLGIGLTLVKTLVELHGGRVEAHSGGHGQGAELVVRLPALVEDAPATAAVRPGSAGAQGVLRVLLVEDNADAAESLRLLLELNGHQVCVADTGPSALAMAEAFTADVALVDLGLPELDGFEVARRLRAREAYRKARIVAVSGYGRDDDKRRAAEAGFDDHVTKPVELATLERLLGDVLRARRTPIEPAVPG